MQRFRVAFSLLALLLSLGTVALAYHPLAFAYFDASNTRLAQYFAGELTLDEAMARLLEQLDEAAANLAAG